ncbi:uncharacterized protein EV422DRAFT_533942 [Fimicolochytrium jonesii]|uniref:uncharacterized protein n=1 Tax=Fimicolochytrium jonesii TaxID=1396493 RepID=UPI0022FEACBA|nr:uncharacterized protein EV422DRAFT_533942 [Fimicolochytrium jonesii]KAI8819689.1 hypothetical protein EV422DRAFT_533942 [Fimicolochytrium jonesii]
MIARTVGFRASRSSLMHVTVGPRASRAQPLAAVRSATTSSGPLPPSPRWRSRVGTAVLGAGLVGTACALLFTAVVAAEEAKEEPHFPAVVPSNDSSQGRSYPATVIINGKELPVATRIGDDSADLDKPRLVVLGSGWGSTSVIKDLQQNGYYTVVISPTNYFLFTPLLPEATTGTAEPRSLTESMRRICRKSRAHFCEAAAYDVHFDIKMIEVVGGDGKHFLVPYDKLVIGVGAINNTFGVPGVRENAQFLKNINDALGLRTKLLTNFEKAALPTTSEEERKRLLSFVIAGGGPTGVEYAAELYDFLHNDLSVYFPELCGHTAHVTIVQSADHILNTFSATISKYAEEHFRKHNVEIITNARVTKVDPGVLTFRAKNAKPGEKDTFDIPFGICVWSTGIGLNDFTKRLVDKLTAQDHKRAIEVDSRLRVKGTEGVYALGDCATIEHPNMLALIKGSFKDYGKEELNYDEFQAVMRKVVDRFPETATHLVEMERLFKKYDADNNYSLDIKELEKLVDEVKSKLTSLPATAQVARQQGEYLAKKFNQQAFGSANSTSSGALQMIEAASKPFCYRHFGSFSYIGGDSAVVDLASGQSVNGFGAFLLWRGAYLAKQVSFRTRFLLAVDWCKSIVFGRDITNLSVTQTTTHDASGITVPRPL